MSDRAAPEPPDPAWLVQQITQNWGKVGEPSTEGDEAAAGALASTDVVSGVDPDQPDAPYTESVTGRLSRRTAAGTPTPGVPAPPRGQTPPRRPRPDPRSRRPGGA